MRIGIDFDRVLFDTDSFKEFLEEKFPDFTETYPEGIYNPGEHAERMGVEKEELMENLLRASDFLFDDVSKLEQIDHEIVIVSRGNPNFQATKIENSGILEYVEDYFLVQEKPKDSYDIDFLVDDLREELEKTDIPGYLFKRPEDTVKDIEKQVEKKVEVEKIET